MSKKQQALEFKNVEQIFEVKPKVKEATPKTIDKLIGIISKLIKIKKECAFTKVLGEKENEDKKDKLKCYENVIMHQMDKLHYLLTKYENEEKEFEQIKQLL